MGGRDAMVGGEKDQPAGFHAGRQAFLRARDLRRQGLDPAQRAQRLGLAVNLRAQRRFEIHHACR